ncbi:MAG: hypothetical protein NC395_09970 [Prevotella sp.]|nr:hypothetical protein [Prevotella sp.]
MLGDINALLGMILVMMLFTVVMDGFTLYNILVKHSDDAVEFACVGLKWLKIVLLFFFGAVMLFYTFTVSNTPLITITELVLGLLLIADGVLSAVVKRKYGTKGTKK